MNDFQIYREEILKALNNFKKLDDDFWKIEPELTEFLDEINSSNYLVSIYSHYGCENLISLKYPYVYIMFDNSIYSELCDFTSKLKYKKIITKVDISLESYYSYFENNKSIDSIFSNVDKKIINQKRKIMRICGFNDKINSFWDSLKELKNIKPKKDIK